MIASNDIIIEGADWRRLEKHANCLNPIDFIGQDNIDPKLLNNGFIIESGSRGSLAWPGRQTHNLFQMRNLEFARGKRPQPEVAGSNPAPETELASVSANGTIRVSATPQKNQSKHIVYHAGQEALIQIENTEVFCLGLFKSLVMGKVNGSYPNQETVLLNAFKGYVKGKVSEKVSYEYMRIVKHFLTEMYGVTLSISDPRFAEKLNEFLDIENPYTYRNTLAALKHFFTYLGIEQYLADFKFKASMPNFSIATPSLEEILKFHDAIGNERIRFYFELGIVSAIRPEHLLRLKKNLFDKPNRMINTWMKTFGKKNFFFSFYTEDMKARVEAYLNQLPKPDLPLFPIASRYIQKCFIDASEKSGVKITPKMMRKFATNWLRRHGMISEDVDAITSHLPYSVVARHYLDHSRIKQEYDSAMKQIIFPLNPDSHSFFVESTHQTVKGEVKA